jgi:hypothetical protein
MEAKDLRIGNWVNFGETQVQVDVITEYEPDNRLIVKCTPIPLTEEWLKKFWFEEGYENLYWTKDEALFQIENGELGYNHVWDNAFTGASVKYVHQLQNLYFALTGTELTVNP